MRQDAILRSAYSPVVRPRNGEAQRVVRPTAHFVGVVVVLTVVLPEADGADVVATAFGQGHEAAAGARVGATIESTDDIHELHGDSLAPTPDLPLCSLDGRLYLRHYVPVMDGGCNEVDWWDFEPLSGVLEVLSEGVREAVVLLFAKRSVEFSAVPEDDTLSMREIESLPEASAGHEVRVTSDDSPWSSFVGVRVRWGRAMTNHRGYRDGYQLEFATFPSAIGDGVELIVAASSIQLGTSRFGD